ncbi:MAG TPA: TetR/AcrR family transcriptional regulator [Acidimicrobiales bacterium]
MANAVSKRDERKRLHQELSSNQILDSAEEIFASKGFHEATIKEIAELAEFSVGALYSFFENKDDLFVQIYLRRGEEFMEGMRSLLSHDRPPRDQLHRLATYQIEFMREHPNFGRLYLRDSAVVVGEVESKIDHAVADRYSEAMRLQAELFASGQEAGVFRDGDTSVLARFFSALVAAFQASDPIVMNGTGGPGMAVDDFLTIVDGAFGTTAAR